VFLYAFQQYLLILYQFLDKSWGYNDRKDRRTQFYSGRWWNPQAMLVQGDKFSDKAILGNCGSTEEHSPLQEC
jgi:hypothetical protein